MTAILRRAVTVLRGRVPCSMSWCGRPVWTSGYCRHHVVQRTCDAPRWEAW